MARPYRLPAIYGTEAERDELEQVARAQNRSMSQTARLLLRAQIKRELDALLDKPGAAE